MAFRYYTVTFTAGKQKKQMGSKSPLEVEDFTKLVKDKADVHNKARQANKGKRDAEGKPVRVNTFFGYEGDIADVSVKEEERAKRPPAGSLEKAIAAEARK